ncbi:unnamed protein product [Didymodactylos carnosus]|uniref:Major facilitator superfamily (MFS) profile domain-containing protein n=1 Tax=Didymodactylos carnosus TaxID=1234261 RepID=A0A814MBU0_9BILA|nr:unnamed protein product [Didymodactylos carnosus]CAF1272290.1 unnamed protein product [Didymodactylos carnosus]CAF3843577.1 unnamed protein product [Didymodactylos carnosus]CAF4077605.1 unnamed protein product [Didymodactylos carnosus]
MAGYIRNDIYFDIMRALQGIGPAAVLPNGIALLARTYAAGRRKSLVFSMFGATAPAGFVVGALFSSIFAQLSWWPWSQWTLAIVCVTLALMAYFVIPAEVSSAVHPMGKIDILGAVTIVAGLVLIVYSWNQGPVVGWNKPYVFVLLIVGFLIVGAFIFIETKVEEPIMPPSIWSVSGFPGVILCVGLGWSSFGIWMFYLVQFIEVLRDKSPLLVTAMLTPLIPGGLTATILVSQLYHRVAGHHLLMASMVFFCVGNILIATAPVDQTYWAQTFVAVLLTPFGMDISFPAASLIVSNSMPSSQQGVAASMINTVINLSVSMGLGIAGTVESQINKSGNDVLRGYRSALYTGIGLSGLGIIVALLFCRVPVVVPADEKKELDGVAVSSAMAGSEIAMTGGESNLPKSEGLELSRIEQSEQKLNSYHNLTEVDI